MQQREEFIDAWLSKGRSITELCGSFGISRKTGYKWIERYDGGGRPGLEERNRAPHQCPHAMEAEVASAIVAARQQHPTWGPRKLRKALERDNPEQSWPAASSMGQLLKREGLVQERRNKRRTPAATEPLGHAQAPNSVWCADFKGWFQCQDGSRCDPLTITDAYSRYLLRCRAVPKADGVHVRAVFETLFRECGLPEAIRTDNGPPFASVAPAGLSRLSMWWLKLGIRHERITPGCPQENGRHERMHRTLKAEATHPAEANLARQQHRFQLFEREYNEIRPHEALDYRTPAEVYVPSARVFPARLPDLAYPAGAHLRRISQQGSLKWRTRRTFVSEVLARETVGLIEIDDEFFEVYYGPVLLGWLDGREPAFATAHPPRKRTR